MQNIDIFKVEFSTDFRSLVNAWNMKIAQWLHRDVFSRSLARFGAPQLSNLLAYSVSAFWHGTYPVYYLSFISGSFISITEKKIWKKYLAPRHVNETEQAPADSCSSFTAYLRTMPLWFKISRIILTQLLLQYLTIAFLILDFEQTWIFWKSLYFYGHLVTLFFFVLF